MADGTCSVPMDDGSICGKPLKGYPICFGHRTRKRTGVPMGQPWRMPGTGNCTYCGAHSTRLMKSLCPPCYYVQWRGGDLGRTRRETDIAARIAKFSVSADDGCVNWTGQTSNGRAHMTYRGATVPVARVVWELDNGPIPDGLHVCHTCDNPLCVNIEHLWLGTNADNMADKVAKGRARNGATGPLDKPA